MTKSVPLIGSEQSSREKHCSAVTLGRVPLHSAIGGDPDVTVTRTELDRENPVPPAARERRYGNGKRWY